jgi:hypothetical protein
MSSKLETSRGETNRSVHGILRLRCAPLRMTMRRYARILFALVCVSAVAAQEPPGSPPSPAADESLSPSPSISPESLTPSPAPAQTPSPSPARSVRISFVPPPMEGTISLGIYDSNGKLVRVLHRQANLNKFIIGADALVTEWDGKNDDGQDLPAARYRARGYVVGPIQLEDLGQTAESPPQSNPSESVRVKLVPNPLANKRPLADLAAGLNAAGSYLKTTDDLPLFTISASPNLIRASITKNGDRSADVWLHDSTGVHRFRISNLDKMMAFDCGEFALK